MIQIGTMLTYQRSKLGSKLAKVDSQEAFVRRFTIQNEADLIKEANKCGKRTVVSLKF